MSTTLLCMYSACTLMVLSLSRLSFCNKMQNIIFFFSSQSLKVCKYSSSSTCFLRRAFRKTGWVRKSTVANLHISMPDFTKVAFFRKRFGIENFQFHLLFGVKISSTALTGWQFKSSRDSKSSFKFGVFGTRIWHWTRVKNWQHW